MIYSFHHFYNWVKGGVESGQAYRARIFRELGIEAKFVFATTFPEGNMLQEMRSLGFLDEEVMWMYGFFTNCRNSMSVYTLKQLEQTFSSQTFECFRKNSIIKYVFRDTNTYYNVYMANDSEEYIRMVEIVTNEHMIRKDYYTYCRIYSEYYTPINNQAHLYLRRFYNEDGTVAYEEILDDDFVMYRFPDRIFYSREELVGYMMSLLNLTEEDTVLIDGEPGMIDRAAFIQNAFPAKVGFIIHADHFLESDENHILWYSIYEYAFAHPDKIKFFITNTDVQTELLKKQLLKYQNINATVLTIPAVGIDVVKRTEKVRKKHSLISVGRLNIEKNMNWVIEAVALAKKNVPDLTLDIYGEGSEKEKLEHQIRQLQMENCIHLCGYQKLSEVYQKYEAYVSASYIETLGVTLLESVASGLPIVSFDIRYGAQIFVDEGKNGYKVPYGNVEELAARIVRLFTEADWKSFSEHSYIKAKSYLTEEMKEKWREALR